MWPGQWLVGSVARLRNRAVAAELRQFLPSFEIAGGTRNVTGTVAPTLNARPRRMPACSRPVPQKMVLLGAVNPLRSAVTREPNSRKNPDSYTRDVKRKLALGLRLSGGRRHEEGPSCWSALRRIVPADSQMIGCRDE